MQCRIQVLCVWLCLAGQAPAEQPQIRLRPVPSAEADAPAPAADVEQVAALLTDMTNALRRQEGCRPLAANPALAKAAGDFAEFMATADKYGHTADGRKPAERVEAAGYDYCLVDENIAWLFQTRGFSTEQLARQLFESWQQSPEHRRNLLDPNLGEIGVAVARSAKTGRYYGVQEFGRPKSEQISFEVSNVAKVALTYRIDGQEFTLEPRFARRHKRNIPPELEVAGYETSAKEPIALHPASDDRYVLGADATGRITVDRIQADKIQAEKRRLERKPATANTANRGD